MTSRLMQVNGVELCIEAAGERAHPAILLIMGSGASMDWWEDEFCERLVDGGRYVIRYDHRDTGDSVSYPPGAPGYTGEDLTADALGVLDALDIASAHVVGISMGGAIAQEVALDHPERVLSLTLIATTAVSGGRSGLPGMSAEDAAAFDVEPPDWSDREAVIGHMLHLARASASPARSFDEDGFRRLAERILDRTKDIQATMTNHDVMDHGESPPGQLGDLTIPTLVIHGHDDPVFPFPHGEALVEQIPGARLLPVEAMGHELPREAWDLVVPAILDQTRPSRRS